MGGYVFETLKDWPEIVGAAKADPAMELYRAVKDKNYPAAYSALRRLKEPLSDVGKCLLDALSCTPKLFRKILEHCEPGEYAWFESLWTSEQDGAYVRVGGTILTLAAALNRPQHMELLLEALWDINSGAPASEQAMYGRNNGDMPESKKYDFIYCSGWSCSLGGMVDWMIGHSTPLAAAITCGSEKAVEVLLRHGGVQKLESAAVCRAGVIALHGTRKQRACLCLALGLQSSADNPDGMAREFFCEHRPDIAAIADLCTPEEFVLRLDAAPCRLEELRAALDALTEKSVADGGRLAENDEKLFALLDRLPELEGEQKVRDHMLNVILDRMLAERDCEKPPNYKRLLGRWRIACGGTRDLSGACYDLIAKMGALGARRARSIFAELGKWGTLCASAESIWFANRGERDCLLAVCLDCVKVYRSTGSGVSILAAHLLQKGNVRLMRLAAERGALQGESKDELLTLLSEKRGSPALRALVLTLPDEQIGVASARPQPEDAEIWRQWKQMEPAEQDAFLRQMWEGPLCAEECRKRLHVERWSRDVDNCFLPLWDGELDGMQISNLTVAACCGRNPELLRVLLEDGEFDPKARVRGCWAGSMKILYGTMLCLAVAAGRTEQARLLLDMGLDPNEDDVPERSIRCESDVFGERQVVTPLYMALSEGHFEIAELLRERGGYAYPPYDGATAE